MEEIGLFPLGLVLLPTEQVPLHIFEPRYRELIGECIEAERPFGLVYADDEGVRDIGIAGERIMALGDLALRFWADEVVPHLDRFDAQQQIDRELWRKAGALGLLCCSAVGSASEFAPPVRVKADGVPIRVESPGYAAPCLADVTGDGMVNDADVEPFAGCVLEAGCQ